jgi:hypothetical protein
MIEKKNSEQNVSENKEYLNKSYEELSKEFKQLYAAAARAYELIPLMYNRLTIVDKLSHSEACDKIIKDHKGIKGFSQRNVQRYLPADNPAKPNRITPLRHKNSVTEMKHPIRLSSTEVLVDKVNGPESADKKEIDCQRFLELENRNKELEKALKVKSDSTLDDNFQSEREFRFPINVLDIKKYLAPRKLANSEPKEIWIIATVDIKRGIFISAGLEGPK